ncbi:MAG: hypothetical protein QW225_07250, partial [Candidatus Jordarchaeales archaeon]
ITIFPYNGTHTNLTIYAEASIFRDTASVIVPTPVNFSDLAKNNKLPTLTFPVASVNMNDLIRSKEAAGFYIDMISMSWSSGTVFEVWTSAGINPMKISKGMVKVNNSEFVLKSNSTVAMGFIGSSGVNFGVKVDRGSGFNYGVVPLVRISALSLFADSWGW